MKKINLMRIRGIFICLNLIAMVSSCGYLLSGTWENDDKNWSRAYNQTLPDSIKLVNSWYWRSPHWTLEQALYFEIDYNQGVFETFLSDPTVVNLDYKDTVNINFFNDKPEWFLPKPFGEYDIWKGNKGSFDNFILFFDKQSRHLFWTDFQL